MIQIYYSMLTLGIIGAGGIFTGTNPANTLTNLLIIIKCRELNSWLQSRKCSIVCWRLRMNVGYRGRTFWSLMLWIKQSHLDIILGRDSSNMASRTRSGLMTKTSQKQPRWRGCSAVEQRDCPKQFSSLIKISLHSILLYMRPTRKNSIWA